MSVLQMLDFLANLKKYFGSTLILATARDSSDNFSSRWLEQIADSISISSWVTLGQGMVFLWSFVLLMRIFLYLWNLLIVGFLGLFRGTWLEHTLAILSNRSSIHTSIGLSDSNTEPSIDFNDKQRFGQSDLLKSSFSKALFRLMEPNYKKLVLLSTWDWSLITNLNG